MAVPSKAVFFFNLPSVTPSRGYLPGQGNLMEGLKALDGVAYVRYASVYRDFREAKDFHRVLGELGDNFNRAPDET